MALAKAAYFQLVAQAQSKSSNRPQRNWLVNVVTDRQISLLRDRDVVEPSKLFFLSGSTVAAAHPPKLARIVRWRKQRLIPLAGLSLLGQLTVRQGA